MKRYCFIINPMASSGRSAGIWRDCKHYLDKRGIKYETYMTSYAGHACEIAAHLSDPAELEQFPDTETVIISLGGDGTLGDVINGINVTSRVTLAYIPSGSGNDFAKGMHISKRWKKALKRILEEAHIDWVDYGVISYLDGKMNQRRFIVSTGAGLDARICQGVAVSPMKVIFNKMHLGKFIYTEIGIQKLFSQKGFEMDLRLDGTKQLHFDHMRFAAIMLTPYEGGGFKMGPAAVNNDGQFDICIVDCKHRIGLIRILLATIFGKQSKMKGVHMVQCQTAAFHMSRKVAVHNDGEPLDELDSFHVVCEKRKLRFVY